MVIGRFKLICVQEHEQVQNNGSKWLVHFDKWPHFPSLSSWPKAL